MSEQPVQQVQPSVQVVRDSPFEPKIVKKTADRPHWITIWLGLLSPCLAVLALVMSIKSLETSRDSLRIGQRAYISATGSLLQEPNEKRHWTFSMVFKNSGNTPGQLRTLTARAVDLDGCMGYPGTIFNRFEHDWAVESARGLTGLVAMSSSVNRSTCEKSQDQTDDSLASISGKDSSVVSLILIDSPRLWSGENGAQTQLPTLMVDFSYRDVFGADHTGSAACKVFSEKDALRTSCNSTGQ